MSSPTKNSQLDLEDRLKYAPPWARRQGPKEGAEPPAPAAEAARDKGRGVYARDLGPPETCGPAIDEEPAVAANAPARPPTWLREPARAFEGDVAMRELRTRMALDPQLVPERQGRHRASLSSSVRSGCSRS